MVHAKAPSRKDAKEKESHCAAPVAQYAMGALRFFPIDWVRKFVFRFCWVRYGFA
jgi:hypothetical protein